MSQSILVVDDSEIIRQQLRLTLERGGFRVFEAASGEAGLQAARNRAFDLLICDINMPGIDGLEMIGQIRRLPGYGGTPVLVLTTETTQEMRKRGKEVGATGWIVKPFKPDILIMGVRKLLGLPQSGAA